MAGISPLIRVVSNKQRMDADAAIENVQSTEQPFASESALAGHIRKSWERNKLTKSKIALRLLKCLRARRGLYSEAEISQMQSNGGLNFIFTDLTETKCRAASAWVREVVMPIGERPFQLDPSPVSDLPLELKQMIVAAAAAKAQKVMLQVAQTMQPPQQLQAPPGAPPPQGQPQGPPQGQPAAPAGIAAPAPSADGNPIMSQQEFRELAREIGEDMRDQTVAKMKEIAQRAASRHEDRIADQQLEGGWDEAMDGFIEDFVTYPTAFMEGPVIRVRRQLKWAPAWMPVTDESPRMTWSRIDPFDAFPAPYAQTPQDGDFIVRKRYRRNELYDCIGLPDYNEENIRTALRLYSNGHLESWLWTESERQRLQQDTLYAWLSPAGVIDAVHFWGSVPGFMLMSWGYDAQTLDPVRDYEVDAILIGPYVIRCAMNQSPLRRRPYRCASFDAIPGSIWGRAVPDLGEVSQKMCNASACALADNLGMASGPMVWVHNDRLADGESALDIYPWRVWQLKSDSTQGVNPGVGFFQPDDRSGPLMAVIEKWEIRADDATGIPRYTYGNERVGGAANTYGGLTTLMNNAAKGLRRAIANIDLGVIQPNVYDAFVYNMLYDPDTSIKADCVVKATGAAAVLIKEAMNQARLTALQLTNNPVDMDIIKKKGRAELLRETIKSLELPVEKVVPSEREIEQEQQEQQAQQQAQMEAQNAGQQQALQMQDQQRQQDQQHQLTMQDRQFQQDRSMQKDKLDADAEKHGITVGADIAKAKAAAAAKAKAVNFKYDDKGNIQSAEPQFEAPAMRQ